jgi:ABC-type lipoprotein export system ATPase subunit
MLKAINVSKTYYTKAGASQKALDNVSIEFDNKGLVFILGKSGSGKSTLLNILGGLDVMDAGNIEIKGKSSAEFNQGDFDSYRNTYLGFIFQDFNILEDFTVRENINLAYELQHKVADENRLKEILEEVEMLEYKDRKPNELSGGQIQRIAIARALIKNPEIIMADEPTGNLDSETGEQVFKTLKKLAKEKLVLVVSHDREAAEEYADRILELKDGKIIDDVTKQVIATKKETKIASNIKASGKKLLVKSGIKLTTKELEQINHATENGLEVEFLSKADSKNFNELENKTFVKTKIIKAKKQKDFKPFELIKSKLPNKNAFKMGKSSLKHKKVKLFFTLFLTIIALTLFGFADVMGSFSVAKASTNTFKNSDYSLLPFTFQEESEYGYYYDIAPTQDIINNFKLLSAQDAYRGYAYRIDFEDMLKNVIPNYNEYYRDYIGGIIEMPDASAFGDDFVGTFPIDESEIVINNYLLEHFIEFGFASYNDQTLLIEDIDNVTSFADIENKLVRVRAENEIKTFKIVGMVNYNLSMYAEKKVRWAEITEDSSYEEKNGLYMYADQYGFLGRLIVKEGFNDANYVSTLSEDTFSIERQGHGFNNHREIIARLTDLIPPEGLGEVELYEYLNKVEIEIGKLQIVTILNDYYFGAGGKPETLGENDAVVPASWFKTSDEAVLDSYLNTKINLQLILDDYSAESYGQVEYEEELNIVGFLINSSAHRQDEVIVPDRYFDYMIDLSINNSELMYTFLNNNSQDAKLFEVMEDNNFRHVTDLSQEINAIAEMFKIMQKIFFYIALVMAMFVAFMIMNFISTSISYKKKEIGILRALGARKADVFKVFYFEGLIIGVISYLITITLIIIGVMLFNSFIQAEMATEVVLIGLGFRQIMLVALICFGTIFLASYFPVNKIASKKPIDAIRGH